MKDITSEQREELIPYLDDYVVKNNAYQEIRKRFYAMSKEMFEAREEATAARNKLDEMTIEVMREEEDD